MTALQRSATEINANATFDALLWALSRPGQIRRLPAPSDAPIVEALIDRECRVYAADPRLMPRVLQTGAEITDPALADFAFFGVMAEARDLCNVRVGSDLYPDDGATVILNARFDLGPVLRLKGPGVEDACKVQIGGLPEGFWDLRTRLLRYPMGFDLFLRDGDAVMGLPRSTHVEVM